MFDKASEEQVFNGEATFFGARLAMLNNCAIVHACQHSDGRVRGCLTSSEHATMSMMANK